MKKIDVFKLLEENKNERGIKIWERFNYEGWTSFGMGLTQLKKLAKQIGKNHELSKELWKEPNYDAKTISILISEPKKLSLEEVNTMATGVSMWMMSHTWVQNLFCKLPFAKSLAEEWRNEEDDVKRRCGFAYLYYLVKDKKTPDTYFLSILEEIRENLQKEENFVRDAMNNALFAIGKRSRLLNIKCIEIAKEIGEVHVDYGDNSCKALNVLMHLEADRLQQKLI